MATDDRDNNSRGEGVDLSDNDHGSNHGGGDEHEEDGNCCGDDDCTTA